MGVKIRKSKDGFALVEGLLLLVIVAAIVGVGAFVVHQKHSAETTLSSSSKSAQAKAPSATAASVDQLTQQDAKNETAAVNSGDSTAQQDATSANGAVGNVGGAYNEANY